MLFFSKWNQADPDMNIFQTIVNMNNENFNLERTAGLSRKLDFLGIVLGATPTS